MGGVEMPAITVPDVGEKFLADFETYVGLRRATRLADAEHKAQLSHIGGFANQLASYGYESPDTIPVDEARALAFLCIDGAVQAKLVGRAKNLEFDARHTIPNSFSKLRASRVAIEALDRQDRCIVDAKSGNFTTKVEGQAIGIWPEEGRITMYGLTRYRRRISSSSPYYYIEAIDTETARRRVSIKVQD